MINGYPYKSALILFLSCTLFSCREGKNTQLYNSKLAASKLIFEKTDIQLDTFDFSVIFDSLIHTEGAFDSDYTWKILLQLNDSSYKRITQNIRTSKYSNTFSSFNISWPETDTSGIKGIWTFNSSVFDFIERPNDTESFYLSIDTTNQHLIVELVHI